jgi:hypothetical protein
LDEHWQGPTVAVMLRQEIAEVASQRMQLMTDGVGGERMESI